MSSITTDELKTYSLGRALEELSLCHAEIDRQADTLATRTIERDAAERTAQGLAERVTLLEAELAAARMGLADREWQPIETAPRNSTARLVWVPENQCAYCVSWDRGDGPSRPPGWSVFGGGWRSMIQRATLWRPCPAPPASP